MRMVYPSGADFETYSVPTTPPAPGLFSTMTGLPQASPRRWAMLRAALSVEPPGANGTTILTAFVG